MVKNTAAPRGRRRRRSSQAAPIASAVLTRGAGRTVSLLLRPRGRAGQWKLAPPLRRGAGCSGGTGVYAIDQRRCCRPLDGITRPARLRVVPARPAADFEVVRPDLRGDRWSRRCEGGQGPWPPGAGRGRAAVTWTSDDIREKIAERGPHHRACWPRSTSRCSRTSSPATRRGCCFQGQAAAGGRGETAQGLQPGTSRCGSNSVLYWADVSAAVGMSFSENVSSRRSWP